MKETNVYTKIVTDENLMETQSHGSQDYPFRYYYEHLAQFDFNCIDWHWHTELEFVYVQSGTVTAWIGEKQLELPADSGIFINSKLLHRFSSPEDAVIPNFLCMPSFLAATDSYIYQNLMIMRRNSVGLRLIFLRKNIYRISAITYDRRKYRQKG